MNKGYLQLDISLLLLSASVIGYQLILMQILSIQQWHYMAFMIISIALLGFGSSGIVIHFYKKHLLIFFSKYYSLLLFATSITMALMPILAGSSLLQFDTYLLFVDYRHILKLFATSFLYFLPFLFAAIAIGITFTRYGHRIGKLYFSNLIGSGLGGVITILMMLILMPHQLPSVIAIFPLVGKIIFNKLKLNSQSQKLQFSVAFIAISFSFVLAPQIKPSQYKSWSKTSVMPSAELKTIKNSPYGLAQTVTAPGLRLTPSISIVNKESIPQAGLFFINGEAVGSFSNDTTVKVFTILNSTPDALPYYLQRRKKALILKSGVGEPIHLALINNCDEITAIEKNPVLQDISKSYFSSFTTNSQLNFKNESVRSFLKTDNTLYDVIIFPTVGSFYGTSGLYAIEEQNWLTIEAFDIAYNRLTHDGVLSISCWLDYPFRSPFKLLATIDEVLKKHSIDSSSNYILGIKNWNQLTFLLKQTPFSELEIEKTYHFCDSLLFDPILLNQSYPQNTTQIHNTGDPEFYNYLKKLTGLNKNILYHSYPFRIQPATDNKPYFSQFLKINSIKTLIKNYNLHSIPYFELGYMIVLITLATLFILGLVFIILPLLITKQQRPKISILTFFSAIGLGYMLTEMLFIHLFNIYFGNPLYSVSIIISILMISSGIGSYFSGKLLSPNTLWVIPLLISILLGLYIFILHHILDISISYNLFGKIVISFLLIGLMGFFMGIPFPTVIKQLSLIDKKSIPSAWAINGFFSVLAAPLAIIISIEIGFSGLFITGGLCYLTASILLFNSTLTD